MLAAKNQSVTGSLSPCGPPEIEPEQVQAIVSTDAETKLALENNRLKTALVEAKTALQKAETDLVRLREVEDKTIRLEAHLEAERTARQQLADQQEIHRKELHSQIALLQEQIKELALQAGRIGWRSGRTACLASRYPTA